MNPDSSRPTGQFATDLEYQLVGHLMEMTQEALDLRADVAQLREELVASKAKTRDWQRHYRDAYECSDIQRTARLKAEWEVIEQTKRIEDMEKELLLAEVSADEARNRAEKAEGENERYAKAIEEYRAPWHSVLNKNIRLYSEVKSLQAQLRRAQENIGDLRQIISDWADTEVAGPICRSTINARAWNISSSPLANPFNVAKSAMEWLCDYADIEIAEDK